MKILFLAANPVDVVFRLRIDQEIREISQKIRNGTLRDQVELASEWAVRPNDLQEALLRHQPDIVHFSGHCIETSEIMLEDEAGMRKLVNKKALSNLFTILKDNVRLVVLNACYGRDQAQALTSAIDFTIGISAAVEDRAAIVFSAHFYQSLAFGRSVQEAYDLAVNELAIEDIVVAELPELLVREGVNPSEARIVKPPLRLEESKSNSSASRVPGVPTAGEMMGPRLIPGDNSDAAIDGRSARTTVGEGRQGNHPTVACLPWLFTSGMMVLTTDILRRFLGGDGGWPDTAAAIVQPILFTLLTAAAILTGTSLIFPANQFMKKAAGLGILSRPDRAWSKAILTGVAFIISLGLWLSLPAFAHYFNEQGAKFQYREQPDLSRARKSYQQAVRLKPSYAQAHYNLALIDEDLQPEKAIEEYLLAIRYDSQIYPAYNNLARLYLRRGKGKDYENALNILSLAGDLSPRDENTQYALNKNLGWANYGLKHYAMAEMYLRKAISLRTDQGAAHCLLAYVLKEQGKAGVAEECFDCVSLAPGAKDLEARWLNDARECLMKGGS